VDVDCAVLSSFGGVAAWLAVWLAAWLAALLAWLAWRGLANGFGDGSSRFCTSPGFAGFGCVAAPGLDTSCPFLLLSSLGACGKSLLLSPVPSTSLTRFPCLLGSGDRDFGCSPCWGSFLVQGDGDLVGTFDENGDACSKQWMRLKCMMGKATFPTSSCTPLLECFIWEKGVDLRDKKGSDGISMSARHQIYSIKGLPHGAVLLSHSI
jgi:hypothetical protein